MRRYPGRFQIGRAGVELQAVGFGTGERYGARRASIYRLRTATPPPGRAHENSPISPSHGRTAGLRTRWPSGCGYDGSREFASVASYWGFIEGLVAERNAPRQSRLVEERMVIGC